MPLDLSESLVNITLEGLFAICGNDRINPPRWEIGVINIPDNHPRPHDFSIEIFKITGSGTPTPVTFNHIPGRNIEIVTNATETLTLKRFPPSGSFDGPGNVGDPNDYRWIVDLEGRQFHSGGVEARPDIPRSGLQKHHKHKVFIDGGELYTVSKTIERYERVRNPQDILILGKLGLAVGINIPRNFDGLNKVTIRNEGASPNAVPLDREIGVRYEVRLKHICTVDEPGIDFDLYYEVLQAKDGTQFTILTENAPIPPLTETGEPISNEQGPLRGANEPQVCNAVLIGQTQQLPGV